MSTETEMRAALQWLAENLDECCPCCGSCAGEQHHDDCTFENDCPKEYMELSHKHALALVALQASK